VICAKTAKPIELPFGLWTQVGPRKHKFNPIRIFGVKLSDEECLRVVAMAANFGTKIAINWLL